MELTHEWIVKTILGFLTFAVGVLSRQVIKLGKQYNANQRGTKALLANEITKAHNFYMRQKQCRVDEKRVVQDMHIEYKQLGGNGIMDKLVNDIMCLPEYDYTKNC